jgi:hypothetical protein
MDRQFGPTVVSLPRRVRFLRSTSSAGRLPQHLISFLRSRGSRKELEAATAWSVGADRAIILSKTRDFGENPFTQ